MIDDRDRLSAPPRPRPAALVSRIAGDGAAGWDIADRAAAAAERGEDVLSLCLGDTSFDTPPHITDKAVQSLRRGRTHYTPVPGTDELRHAIAGSERRLIGGDWTPANVIVFAGAQNALFAAMNCVAGPGDEVVLFEPWYATYEACTRFGGASVSPVQLSGAATGGRRLDPAALTAAITPATRALLLNAPNNPGGYLLSEADLEVIAQAAIRHNPWVVSDEVYRSCCYEAAFISISSLPGMAARTIVVNSLSKSHAMTGWRIGWTLSSGDMAKHLENTAQCMLFGSPGFIQDAAAVALSPDSQRYVSRFAAELRARRDIVLASLHAHPELSFERPAGGMFVFADVSGTGLDGGAFAEQLYERAGVAVVPGFAFGPAMTSFVRISFSASRETLTSAMQRLSDFLQSLRGAAGASRSEVARQ
jgi:aspartate/methionine/tyrosine aminotransferase